MNRRPPLAVLVLAAPPLPRFGSPRPVALHSAASRSLLERALAIASAVAESEPGTRVALAGSAEVLASGASLAPGASLHRLEGAVSAAEAVRIAFAEAANSSRVLVLPAEVPLVRSSTALGLVPSAPGAVVVVGAEPDALPPGEALRVETKRDLAAAEAVLRERAVLAALDAGATLVRPETVTLDDTVVLEADCVVGPYATLSGETRVGTGSRVGQGCIVADSVIGRGVEVRPYCVLEKAVVGDGAVVGPFARLREGTELGPEVHVGNFVETKKARLGRGAKANHLTYLGDAEVGERTNVGAGVITCNYDGVFKHRTTIGAGAFIGSDVQLVAPVVIGDEALVAAGTTVTKDVPDGALALARTPQKNLEGQGRAFIARKKAEKAAKAARASGDAAAPKA